MLHYLRDRDTATTTHMHINAYLEAGWHAMPRVMKMSGYASGIIRSLLEKYDESKWNSSKEGRDAYNAIVEALPPMKGAAYYLAQAREMCDPQDVDTFENLINMVDDDE